MVRPVGPRRRARPVRLAGSGALRQLAHAAPRGLPRPAPPPYFLRPRRSLPAGSTPGCQTPRGPPSTDPLQPGSWPSRAGRSYPVYPLSSCPILHPQQRIKILSGIEPIEVVKTFADADELHRHRKLSFDTKHNACSRAAVHFREREPGQTDRLLKHLHLLRRVLSDVCVKHREDLLRRERIETLQDAAHLP